MKRESRTAARKRMLKSRHPDIILNIRNLKCSVTANPVVYDKVEIKKIKSYVNILAKNISIDKTYVNFKGNRFKDAFIVEDKWYEFARLLIKSDLGRYGGEETNEIITDTTLLLALTYIYQTMEKIGYETEDIDISFKKNIDFEICFEEDLRKSWNF